MSCWLNKSSANRRVSPFSKRFLWVPTRMETRKTWVKLPLDVFRHRCWKFCPIFCSVFHSILLSLQRKLLKWSIEPGTRLCAWWFYDFCLLHPEDIVNVKKKKTVHCCFSTKPLPFGKAFSLVFFVLFYFSWNEPHAVNCDDLHLQGTSSTPQHQSSSFSRSCTWVRFLSQVLLHSDGETESVNCLLSATWSHCFCFHPESDLCFFF